MKCQNCNTSNEYRFLTHCMHCQGEIEPSHTYSNLHSVESVEKRLTWQQRVLNVGYIFASSVAGMISGAVVVYPAAVVTCSIFLPVPENPSDACAQGAAIGFLSIVTGAYLGTVAGSVFAVKQPLCKVAGK